MWVSVCFVCGVREGVWVVCLCVFFVYMGGGVYGWCGFMHRRSVGDMISLGAKVASIVKLYI